MSATIPALKRAMGERSGDYLTIGNQWETITIERDGNERSHIYVVDGRTGFPTLQAAMDFALRALAEYEQGRVS